MILSSRFAAATLCVVCVATNSQASAAPVSSQAVAEAERLRNAGQFAEAVRLLEAHLAANGNDALATRRLAQTLYWMRDVAGARAVYERGLQQFPDDGQLRLEYARLLLETGDRRRARALAAPLRDRPDTRGEASALLGTLAYWDGDYTAAARLFREALQAGSTDPEVRRQLQDLRILSAPWIQFGSDGMHDDQPIDRVSSRLAAGWFVTPLVPIDVRMDWHRYHTDDGQSVLWTGRARLRGYVPAAHLEIDGEGGLVTRRGTGESDWIGRVGLGLRLGQGISLHGEIDRSVYLRTVASLSREVTVNTGALVLKIDHPRGWRGEASLARDRFFDDNDVERAHAWLLIPLVRRPSAGVQAGYAFAATDAAEVRFVLPAGDRQTLLSAPASSGLGRYDPYYTPLVQRSHSALTAVHASSGRATFDVSGSVGLRAEEDFPFFFVDAGLIRQGIGHRRFTPWSARVAASARLGSRVQLHLDAGAGRAAFYRWLSAGIQLTYRFAPRDAER
jgi:tetratricopeptide (TPR) repeat protein